MKQLVIVSIPRIAEGLVTTLVYFPFDALFLSFGTTVNAGYQIGRWMYHQVAGPLYRSSPRRPASSWTVAGCGGRGNGHNGYAYAAFSLLTLIVA